MASKKDKFKAAADKRLKKATGKSGNMSDIVKGISEDRKKDDPEQQQKAPDTSYNEEEISSKAEPVPPEKEKTEDPPGGQKLDSLLVEVEVQKPEAEEPPEVVPEPPESGKEAEESKSDGKTIVVGETTQKLTEKEQDSTEDTEDTEEEDESLPIDSEESEIKSDYPIILENSMPRSRESIYNVSSDIRLEDYTESNEQGKFGNLGKIAAGLLLLVLVGWGASEGFGLLFAPEYILAVSAQPITNENLQQFSLANAVQPAHGSPVYVRFQWNDGDLKTDYIKVRADRMINGTYREEASKGRRLPETVTYIYFTTVLDPGKYRVIVEDRGGSILKEKIIRVR